jgi:hypothetical protein
MGKNYDPILFWLVIVFIAIYIPWCVGFGLLLRKRIDRSKLS